MEGFNNKYSATLLVIMISLAVSGISSIIFGGFWLCIAGIIIIALAALMLQGFKQPDQEKAEKKWIITFNGKPTDEIVDSLTLLLDWFVIPIVSYIEVNMNSVTHKYPGDKLIKCKGGYLEAEEVVTFRPDPDTKKGTELYNYVRSGEAAVKEQLNAILTVWLQWFANLKEFKVKGKVVCDNITCDWMEANNNVITDYIRGRIEGEHDRDDTNEENSTLDDLRGMGVKITKLSIVLTAPEKVIEARLRLKVQEAEQQARDALFVSTRNEMTKRAKLLKEPVSAKHHAQIVLDTLIEADKVTAVITQGGLVLNEIKN